MLPTIISEVLPFGEEKEVIISQSIRVHRASAGKGYTKITPVAIKDLLDGQFYYLDTDVERGRTYCYRILAEFAKTTPGGLYTYNVVESLPSEEKCVQLSRDVPLITNVSVMETDPSNGLMEVCWSKPKASDLDTLLNPGPYRYEVLRAVGFTENPDDFQPIGISFTSPSFAEANDTCFTDTGLNTVKEAYSYLINFYVSGQAEPLGATNTASSVFLTVSPTDNRNVLTWEENVPWDNFDYIVYRQNPSSTFDSIATVGSPSYTDVGLKNGQEYCYKIESVGSYGVEGIINPIINFSQEVCETPIDNVAPCPPTLEVENICDRAVNCTEEEDLENRLNWVNPMDLCEETDDVVGYNIYYSEFEGGEFSLIASFDDSGIVSFDHKPVRGIAGCYAVTAIDTFNNESALSNIICVDNCPTYELTIILSLLMVMVLMISSSLIHSVLLKV